MAALNLSPLFNGYQSFLTTGLPNNGGFIYVYQAGTTTATNTWTTSTGAVANPNPIVLASDGRVTNEIWLSPSLAYKFVVTDSSNNVLGTYDNIPGITSYANGNPVNIAYSTTTTVDASLSNIFYVGTLTGNTTLVINNPADGQTINIRFVQDGIGGRTVTLPGTVSVTGSIITTASYVDWLTLTYVSSAARWEGCWANATTTYGATGIAVMAAATPAAGRAALGSTTVGDAVFSAATSQAAREALQVGNMGFRNKLINGAMAIDQRNNGNTQTFTAGAALAYSVDRWYGYCTGANVTGSRVAGSSPTQYRYQFTGTGSVTAIGFGQRIETLNSYDLSGQTCTLSVDLANSLLTTVTWTAYYANSTDTFGTLASPTRTQIATGTFTVNSTVTRYSASMAVPSAATTGIEIVFTVGAQTSGTWTIGNVQFEYGAAATIFETRSYQTELAMCQRYYEKSYDITVNPATALSAPGYNRVFLSPLSSATYFAGGMVYFKTTKRTAPTITTYSPTTGTAGKAVDTYGSAGGDVNASTSNAGMNSFMWSATAAAAATQYEFIIHWAANAEMST